MKLRATIVCRAHRKLQCFIKRRWIFNNEKDSTSELYQVVVKGCNRSFVTITYTGKDVLVGNGGCCGCETISGDVLPQVEIPEKWTQEPPCFGQNTWCADLLLNMSLMPSYLKLRPNNKIFYSYGYSLIFCGTYLPIQPVGQQWGIWNLAHMDLWITHTRTAINQGASTLRVMGHYVRLSNIRCHDSWPSDYKGKSPKFFHQAQSTQPSHSIHPLGYPLNSSCLRHLSWLLFQVQDYQICSAGICARLCITFSFYGHIIEINRTMHVCPYSSR